MSEISVPMTVSTLMMRMIAPARYMSWLSSAFSSSGPVVGSDSTEETTTSPETSAGSVQPMVETNGLSATRNGYLTGSAAIPACRARGPATT